MKEEPPSSCEEEDESDWDKVEPFEIETLTPSEKPNTYASSSHISPFGTIWSATKFTANSAMTFLPLVRKFGRTRALTWLGIHILETCVAGPVAAPIIKVLALTAQGSMIELIWDVAEYAWVPLKYVL